METSAKALSFFVGVFIAIWAFSFSYREIARGTPTEFNHSVWLSSAYATSVHDAPRLKMADGLLKSKILIGLSKKEIQSMLGPETGFSYLRHQSYDSAYWLGPTRGFVKHNFFEYYGEWLVLNYGKNLTVSEANIVIDSGGPGRSENPGLNEPNPSVKRTPKSNAFASQIVRIAFGFPPLRSGAAYLQR